MCEMNEKIDKIFGRSSFSFRSKVGHLVQWTFGSMGNLVQWTIRPMIGSRPMLSIWSVLDIWPILGIWPVLGIWSDMYQTSVSIIDDQASELVASGSNELGQRKKNINIKLFSKGLKSDDVCNYWKSYCFEKQSESAVVIEDDTMSEQDFALVVTKNAQHSDVWVLDTGVSYHMCLRREWFSTYAQVENGCIQMANSSISQVAGIGSIQIRTHDGRFCTLNDVRHVPSMEKNLISLNLLDSRGLKYSGGDRFLQVCQGSDVILKGVIRGTLYILQGFTVIGSTNVASAEVHKEDMTKLYHMRLGHMSERGMQILSKEDLLCSQKIKRLRTDNGLEFCSSEFNQLYKDEGVARHHTVRDTPQQNGVAERMNQTLLERARCMLSNAGLEKRFWAEAVNTTCYLINRGPHTGILCRTPTEMWSSKSADYSNLKIFGCTVYYHINEGKLEPRARKGVFVGYGDGVKGFRIWSPLENRVILSRNVVFDEVSMLGCSVKSTTTEENGSFDKQVELTDDQRAVLQQQEQNQELQKADGSPDPVKPQPKPYSIALNRTRRIGVGPPQRYGYEDTAGYCLENMAGYALQVAEEVDTHEPSTYQEAVSGAEAEKWFAAMGDEMESHSKNQTWDLVTRPPGRKIVTCKWIFKIKEGISPVEGVKYKARVVARGFSQREGVDYNEIFSPVVRHTSIRTLLAIVANQDLELEQLDVKTAFLHGVLEEEIYMTQPDGFQVPGKEDHVCKLNKSLYGLKQSPRQWYKRFDSYMMELGYIRSPYDCCVYTSKLKDESYVYLVLYVDDMLIAAKQMCDIQRLKDLLSAEFEMKDLGAAKKILGMEILRDRSQNKLFLSQKGYIQKVLNRFGMLSAKPIDTPFAANIHLTMFANQSEEEKEYMSRVPYANAVGSLMYAMVCTRPDLAHAVSVVSRFMGQPGKEHWLAVKRIFRYLRGTSDVGLIYGGEVPSLIAGYSDSDYAGDVDSRRSMTGYVFTLGNSVISWKATLQPTVTLSTTEAEYMALTEAAKEGIWLKGLVSDLGLHHDQATVYCDSLSAICLAKDQVHHERTKHIDVRYHFLRNEKRIQVKKGEQAPDGAAGPWRDIRPLKRHQAPDGASDPSGHLASEEASGSTEHLVPDGTSEAKENSGEVWYIWHCEQCIRYICLEDSSQGGDLLDMT
ncbi:Integrase catalytic core [Arabidopsis thaliana x Arabidopsis arenosa]|uniref:Integrase catalytic core n=1 Tax=Arabidopsis thaliana x Arabidopsis arenosa TaxID=1240361 RepID=A0A8T1ZIY7_9BRAS|nr:Integrase catalytic core [Arabidopsis thaliana x Arabidopsis arenosa]